MNRKKFLLNTLAAGSALYLNPLTVSNASATGNNRAFLLSDEGSSRATAYDTSNKIVTRNGRTHVTWLDSPPEGFRVRIRTLDHTTGQWSPAYTIGEAADNHGGPAMTIDSRGFLHIAYYPHHDEMRYRKSSRPNDASAWDDEESFGHGLSYPTLLCGHDDTLYLTARFDRRPDKSFQAQLWKRPAGQQWQLQGPILQSRHLNYGNFSETLAWGPDHKTIHLSCRFVEEAIRETTPGVNVRFLSIAYMVSKDYGKTWLRSDGTEIELPATPESLDLLATGVSIHQPGIRHTDDPTQEPATSYGRGISIGNLAVSASGQPYVTYSIRHEGRSHTFITRLENNNSWNTISLNKFLPEPYKSWNLTLPGGLSFDSNDQLFATAMMQDPKTQHLRVWGNPTSEVVRFHARDKSLGSFDCDIISPIDPATPNWLANIERATGHNEVSGPPAIIYTAGEAAMHGRNLELTTNEVYFVKEG